jgi:hypothetical protein
MNVEDYISHHPRLNLRGGGTRGEYRGHCPFHPGGDYDCFAINVETGQWLCRASSCGLRGSFPLFYKLLEGIQSWKEVQSKLGLHRPLKSYAELLDFQTKLSAVRVSEVRYQELPVTQVPVTAENFPPYLRYERRYDETLLNLGFDLRIGTSGSVLNRLVIPFYDMDNRLCTWTARSMDPNNSLRYTFPEGATTDQFLFGLHRLNQVDKLRRIFLVEGQFDVFRLATFGEVALGISTAKLSNAQVLLLKKVFDLFCVPVWVCLDATAQVSARNVWLELRSVGVKSKQVDISEFAKDPDELTFERFKQFTRRYEV